MQLRQLGQRNLKIHYIWTFFSSFVFLSPVLSLYYLYHGLDISDIIFLTAIYQIFVGLLEIPTSTIGDTWSKSKTMLLSVVFAFLSSLLYFLFPFYFIFIIAVFFGALSQALWSGTGHAKLEEDLKSVGREKDFKKVLGQLIALLRVGNLLTPIFIYFILKNFNNGYSIIAFVDVVIWGIVIIFVSQFKDTDFSSYRKLDKGIKQNLSIQLDTLKKSFKHLLSNKKLLYFLLLILLGTDGGLIAITFLPIIVDFHSIQDYVGSLFTWIITFSSILGGLLAYRIANLFGDRNSIIGLFLAKGLLYLLLYFFYSNTFVVSIALFLSTFIGIVIFTIWNGVLVEMTQINEKSTTRSIFLSIVSFYSFILLYFLSRLDLGTAFLFISILLILVSSISLVMKK